MMLRDGFSGISVVGLLRKHIHANFIKTDRVRQLQGGRWRLVAEHLPSTCEALASVIQTLSSLALTLKKIE